MNNNNSDTGSFVIIPDWLWKKASGTAIKIYCVLASHADYNTGKCWPSHKKISEKLDISISTVKRSIIELRDLKAITIKNRFNDDGSPSSNMYKLFRVDPDMNEGESKSELSTVQNCTTPSVHGWPTNETHITIPNEQEAKKVKIDKDNDPKFVAEYIKGWENGLSTWDNSQLHTAIDNSSSNTLKDKETRRVLFQKIESNKRERE